MDPSLGSWSQKAILVQDRSIRFRVIPLHERHACKEVAHFKNRMEWSANDRVQGEDNVLEKLTANMTYNRELLRKKNAEDGVGLPRNGSAVS